MEPEDVPALIGSAPGEEIRDAIVNTAKSTSDSAIATLKAFLLHRCDHTLYKSAVPRLACLALLQKGSAGVKALVDVLPKAPGSIYPTSIVEALWHASKGRTPDSVMMSPLPPQPPLTDPISPEVRVLAEGALRDVVAESVVYEDYFNYLFQFLYQESIGIRFTNDQGAEERRELFSLLSEGSIKLSVRLISQFRQLIDASRPEEEYQEFLKRHPVLLDPLASVVIPKQKLGIEFVTDFAIKRCDDKYILVEIEKPQDRIFTASDDFSAQFAHAMGQVLDFQQWVDSNGDYARRLMPGISSPRGLLVMGRRTQLSSRQEEKLHRFNVNSAAVYVSTYDDILEQSELLYHNLHHHNRRGASKQGGN